MPFSVALPFALSAIQSLIKFRGRVDTILSLYTVTEALPFMLPDVPMEHGPHVKAMVAFFKSEEGKNILVLRGLEPEWSIVSPEPAVAANNHQKELVALLNAYYDACNIQPKMVGPNFSEERFSLQRGSTQGARLAFYVVESDRLSRNPAVTRVLLAAADTLLEFGADHATQMIANPRTKALVQSLLVEFAQNRDWDEDGAGQIFKTLLGCTALAVLQNPKTVPDQPVAAVLFAALRDVEKQTDSDFVAKLITREGFQAFLGRCLVQTAQQPGLLPDKAVLQPALAAMLKTAGENLESIFLRQPGAVEGVLEAGIAAAATAATPLIDKKLGGLPLLAVVFKSVLTRMQSSAEENHLFATIADGALFAAVYKIVLQSVASNPKALATQADLDEHAAKLISAWAGELANAGLNQALTTVTLRALAAHALQTAAEYTEFFGARGPLLARIVGAALAATAQVPMTGFKRDDLFEIADMVVRTAAANVTLTDLDERLAPLVTALGVTLNHEGLSAVTSAAQRKKLFFGGLEALTDNPKIWGKFADGDLVRPLVTAVVHALATDPTGLLVGPALVPAFQQTLQVAALRGQVLLDKKTTPVALETVLTVALKAADGAVGQSIDGKMLPQFLSGVVRAFLATPFDVTVEKVLNDWLKTQLAALLV